VPQEIKEQNGPHHNTYPRQANEPDSKARRKSGSLQVFGPQDPTERPLALAPSSNPALVASRPAENLTLPPGSPGWQDDILKSPGVEDILNLRPSSHSKILPRHAGIAGVQEGVGVGDDDLEVEIDLGEGLGSPGARGDWGITTKYSLRDSGKEGGRPSQYLNPGGMRRDEGELLETGLWSP